jgi:transcription elongation GreA/GreB family factor
MSEDVTAGPSLIKLGKLANARDFDKLEGLWPDALAGGDYTWRELIPIAGQVGRQNAPARAERMLITLVEWVETKKGTETALTAVREAASQQPAAAGLSKLARRLYQTQYPAFEALSVLLDLLLDREPKLDAALVLVDLYVRLQPGAFALDRSFLVPGMVEKVESRSGQLALIFQDRRAEYGPDTVLKLSPRPADDFSAMMLYVPGKLREMAASDPAAFVKLALRSSREGRVMYKDLKGHLVALLDEKGWKDWWNTAKPALKRDPMIGMSDGSQPSFKLLRQADRFEDRMRREFDFAKTTQEKLQKVAGLLDELSRGERSGETAAIDDALMVYLGNGVAKLAMSSLAVHPAMALAGLALHSEIAARGVAVATPNPRAPGQVLQRIGDPGHLCQELPENLLMRVLHYLREAMPDSWGAVWASVLMRTGRRLCDTITRALLEANQLDVLASALRQAMEKPTASPELLCWAWRSMHSGNQAAAFLATQSGLPAAKVADAMFALLDGSGRLYGMSGEEKHLKMLENARTSFAVQNNRPLLALLEEADRAGALRLKRVIEDNAGLSPAQRTQLLGYLRARYADIFIEATREWQDGAVIYTTEDGMRRTEAAFNFIVQVEIPEVARQIGEAASHGDLSENSEYTAALEKRDQLASRAARLESELSTARIINLDMGTTGFVNVGTRVTARQLETGAEEIYTFLGPWDTDVENRVLNYQAPLAQAFMGARVGETVTYGEDGSKRSWEILEIEAAL